MRKPFAVIATDTHKTKENLALVESIFDQAIELALDLGVKRIFHGGDWFTNRVGQNLATLMAMKRVFDKIEKAGLIIDGIPGNHDKTDQDSADSYLDIFSGFGNFNLHSEGGLITHKDITVAFLPYFSQSYTERLKELELAAKSRKTTTNILLTHKAFNGVRNNDGSLVDDGVSRKAVKFWDKVLVGHYHDACKVGKNIFYIGSTYQSNYGENITDKGFTILYDDGSTDFEPSQFPKYQKIKLDASDEEAIETELEHYANSDDNVRFVFTGSKTDLDKINLSKFTDAGIDCKFESNEINEEILNVESDNFQQLDKKSIMKHFMKYCKVQGIESSKIKQGLKILNDDGN